MTPANRLLARVAITALIAVPTPSMAHATVSPKHSSPGAWETYEIRLPNEKTVATTALEVRFPAGLQVKSFEDKPGWTIEPLRDSSGAITGARWTGQLAPERFVELGIIAVNPKAGGELTFSATQSFADGSIVRWSGPAGSATPAPRVILKPVSH
jgi:uncharacterized protein YcnI